MDLPPGIPLLGGSKPGEEILEGITARPLKETQAAFPVGMKDGKPIVGKISMLHLSVQFRFVLQVPLPLNDPEESKQLLHMVMNEGLQPEWKRLRESLDGMEQNLHKGAEMAVKTEHAARVAAQAEGKKP